MKKIMMIALLMVVAITGAKAQLLYKISGKDLKQPSYIEIGRASCRERV